MVTERKKGFDSERYLAAQVQAILDRVEKCGNKLYIEFGGKILLDYHAARVLPGFDPNLKIRPLLQLKDRIEIIFCVNARDVQGGRVRGDFGLTYDLATLRTLDDLRTRGLPVSAVVITRFKDQPAAIRLKSRLERRGVRVFTHAGVPGYPSDVNLVASPAGFGINSYIETSRPIVVITGAGPGSGKIETALQQMWHDHQRGILSGFAKWETFPVWDLPLDHPLNVVYEAATADIRDRNMIDPFHLAAYGKSVVNYNRDVDHFPILRTLLESILGDGGQVLYYRSPTDMCVNCVSQGIVNDDVVREAARQEIIRRYLRHHWEYTIGIGNTETMEIARDLMEKVGLKVEDRRTVLPAREAADEARDDPRKGYKDAFCGAAIELPDGDVVKGKNSAQLYSTAAAIINALKRLAGIPDKIYLLSPLVIRNLVRLKDEVLGENSESLDISEALAALSVSAAHNPAAEAAFEMLPILRECDMHMTHVPTQADQDVLRKLGVMFTTDAQFTPGGYFLS
jgi:uncharacterized protein (UPF0371 family)